MLYAGNKCVLRMRCFDLWVIYMALSDVRTPNFENFQNFPQIPRPAVIFCGCCHLRRLFRARLKAFFTGRLFLSSPRPWLEQYRTISCQSIVNQEKKQQFYSSYCSFESQTFRLWCIVANKAAATVDWMWSDRWEESVDMTQRTWKDRFRRFGQDHAFHVESRICYCTNDKEKVMSACRDTSQKVGIGHFWYSFSKNAKFSDFMTSSPKSGSLKWHQSARISWSGHLDIL
jgi:hypothetical protein